MKFEEVYRKDKFGKMVCIGHLEPNGALSHYATILNQLETEEEGRESYKFLYFKNNLGMFELLTKTKLDQIKALNQFNILSKSWRNVIS